MKKHQIPGSCHCKNIEYTFHTDVVPEDLPRRKCGCDFCLKHAAVYTSDSQGELRIKVANQDQLSKYNFGHGTADVHLCARCGVEPFFICEIEGNKYAVLNLNTTDPQLPTDVHVKTDFNSEVKESRLERRKRTWIGTVVFEGE